MRIVGGPAVILVEPQLGENIGAAARAMYNFGLEELRLVRPRDGWPNERAVAMASGASPVLDKARVFDSVSAAVADLNWIGATTARMREMNKPVLDAGETAATMAQIMADGATAGLLFGPERTGLENDHVALADAVVTFPVNPAFASLNLGQAVLIVGYEWFKATAAKDWEPRALPEPAPRAELEGLFEHLESELDTAAFLRPVEKRPAMVRNIRTMFLRAGLSSQDVRTLRGIVRALAEYRPAGKRPDMNRTRRSQAAPHGVEPPEGDE